MGEHHEIILKEQNLMILKENVNKCKKNHISGHQLQVRFHRIQRAVGGSATNASLEPCGDVGLDHGSEVHLVLL